MSGAGPANEGPNPFQGIFGDIFRLLGTGSGPLNWDVARQVGVLLAGEGQSEPNVDPVARIQMEELARIAELHVAQATGLSFTIGSVEAVNHVDWTVRTLDAYRPLLETLARRLGDSGESSTATTEIEGFGANDPMAGMERALNPLLLGMQLGGMVGHLSRRALGQYDFPVPREANDRLVFLPANLDKFAEDWSLPLDELRMYVVVEETTRLAVFSRPHVRQRLTELITDYVNGFRPDVTGLQERLGQLDLSDPSSLPAALNDPQALIGSLQTPEQERTLAYLHALTAVMLGYVDHITRTITRRITTAGAAITEANVRRRVEDNDGSRLLERLFGLELSQPQFDRGEAFISGVLERDPNGLDRLWRSAHELPTPAEVAAPGLWLERINLPQDDES
jgi:putative hydrolase